MKAGCAKVLITPWRGVELAGYFNPRPNDGVLDDIYVRALLLSKGRRVTGVVTFDLCMLADDFIKQLLARLSEAGFRHGTKLIFNATHTHTAPYSVELFGTSPDPGYLEFLLQSAVSAILQAERNLEPAQLEYATVKRNPIAFNRRYWMKDGSVMTNPGAGNPEIVKVEGPVDRSVSTMVMRQRAHIAAILVNLVNHTDTVGTSQVSGDWPGRMERGIQEGLGYDPVVLTLIGCAGNINHFDVKARTPQGYDYRRTREIGAHYATTVLNLIERARELPEPCIKVITREFKVPFRKLSSSTFRKALEVMQRTAGEASKGDMTSEGLADGDGAIAHFFASQTVAYYRECAGRTRSFRLLTIALGAEFALTSLPGEPFTEIGLAIKAQSPFKETWPVSLALGACGYIPLAECFQRGGYETLPVVGGAPREDTAARLLAATLKNLAHARRAP